MSTPPCVPDRGKKPHSAQTLVADTSGCPDDLITGWAAARLLGGDGAFARVRLLSDETFLVLTLAQPGSVESAAQSIRASIRTLPGSPEVRWVRPLTRRLQCLFGWDCAAAPSGSTELAVLEPLDRPACSWRQHPTSPQPFFVQDFARWPDAEKLAWIRQDLGGAADLQEFCRAWLDRFSDSLKGAVPQKAACLKLWGEYSGSAWRKECDLPPEELVAFQRLWEPSAPERCSECSKAAPPPGRHAVRKGGRPFCSEACACAGKRPSCRRCGGAVDAEHPRCTTCAWGLEPAPRGKGALGARLEESELALAKFLRITRATERQDEAHEPAWKRRRRA